jgi:dUTP pyrophosphatase
MSDATISEYYPIDIKLFDDDKKWMISKANPGDSGYDLKARAVRVDSPTSGEWAVTALDDGEYILCAGQRALIFTGVFLAMPEGFEAQVRSRSGLAFKKGVVVLNSPGTIDSCYRNEIGCILINHSNECFKIKSGDRIAQLVFARVPNTSLVTVRSLDDTQRGLGGFGSTGTK